MHNHFPGKSNCTETLITKDYISCIRKVFKERLEDLGILCKAPFMIFTDLDTSKLKFCSTPESTKEVEKNAYDIIIAIYQEQVCGLPCTQTSYDYEVSLQSAKTVAYDPHIAQDERDYFIIWIYYTSLKVEEKIEKYLYGPDTALVAIGGSMGLFLGWSCNSILIKIIEFLSTKKCLRSSVKQAKYMRK